MAHDFNNLLTAISGHCDLLLLRHDQGDADYSDLTQINQNANRAAALVGQLLAFSRKQNLRPEVLDMRDTPADLTHLLNRLVGEKATLTLSHDPVLEPIRADKRHLEQVLMNLVVNARDAMPSGGEIRILTECVTLEEPLTRDQVTLPLGQYVTIKVSDDGVGIPQDKLQKVFEPFFTTKRVGEGTGLGLSTAYDIIKQTGGYIFVDSTEGSGTCFTLYFPVLSQTAHPAATKIASSVEEKLEAPKGGVSCWSRTRRLCGHLPAERSACAATQFWKLKTLKLHWKHLKTSPWKLTYLLLMSSCLEWMGPVGCVRHSRIVQTSALFLYRVTLKTAFEKRKRKFRIRSFCPSLFHSVI